MGVMRTPLSATYVPEAIARAKSLIARRDVHGCHKYRRPTQGVDDQQQDFDVFRGKQRNLRGVCLGWQDSQNIQWFRSSQDSQNQ